MTRKFIYRLRVDHGLVMEIGIDSLATTDLPDLTGFLTAGMLPALDGFTNGYPVLTDRVPFVRASANLDTTLAYFLGLVHASVSELRLTLTSGTPVTTADVSAATTIYLTPYLGDKVSLYDTTNSAWKMYALSEISVAVPSTQWRSFDIFAYDNAGTPALETLNWSQLTGVSAITAATNASPIQVTSANHGLATGDSIFVSGLTGNTGLNNGQWYVTRVDANNFTCTYSVGNGVYVNGGSWWQLNGQRATALTQQDGVYVKTGDASRRYLGSGCTNATSGQTDDKQTDRLLYNFYNRAPRFQYAFYSGSHTYATNYARYVNADPTKHSKVLIGLAEARMVILAALLTGDGTNPAIMGTDGGTGLAQLKNAGATQLRLADGPIFANATPGCLGFPILENSSGAASVTIGTSELRGIILQ